MLNKQLVLTLQGLRELQVLQQLSTKLINEEN